MRLTVHPGAPLSGAVRPPGDKSVTHRAYLLGMLSEGETVVEGPNPGADCAATLVCAERLGAACRTQASQAAVPGESVARPKAGSGRATAHRRDAPADAPVTRVTIRGRAGSLAEPDRVLDCGNSGTTLRVLAGALAAQPFLTVLAGDESLHRRPVARVIEPLRRMGATLSARDGDRLPPLVIRGAKLSGIHYDLPVASAQVASCVLFAALGAGGETVIALPGPARDHTERMLRAFGVEVESVPRSGSGPRIRLAGPVVPRAARVRVPGDFSAAAFFLAVAAATPGASVTALGVSLNPTRLGLLDALERMGARIERRMLPAAGEEPLGDVTVTGPERLRGVDLPPEWVPRMIDEIPAWAIAAACARGRSRVAGAAELRVKESDRLALIAANLGALGIEVREHPDGLEIEGGRIGAGTVRSDGDHRIAMAFLALGTRAAGPVTVDDAASIATSYPGFVEALAGLGGQVETGAPARPGASPGPVARSGRGGRAQAAASAGRARPKRTVGRAAQAAQRRRAS